MSTRREFVPFFVTIVGAGCFFAAVAWWSRPARTHLPSRPTSSPPCDATSSSSHEGSLALSADAPARPPPPTRWGSTATVDAGSQEEPYVIDARRQLDELRARLETIDGGGVAATVARRALVGSAAPAIHEALSAPERGFDARYDAYRAEVVDGEAPASERARHLRPDDLSRAALLDELSALSAAQH